MKKMKFAFLALVSQLALAAEAKNPALIDMEFAGPHPAPEALELDSYLDWVWPLVDRGDGNNATSAFTPLVFEWYEEESRRASLPREVYEDPGRIFVNVDRPLKQTIELEKSGDIQEGNTVGAEVYAEFDSTVEEALEAMLFSWGKPVGQTSGYTYPAASPFARRVDYFAPLLDLGPGAYANLNLRRDGGIIKDLADRYLLLVRGNSQEGYTVVMQFIRPALQTSTEQVFAMAILRPLPGGKTSYRISTRFQGQSYKVLGNVSIGRAQIGFNKAKVRAVAEEYRSRIQELRATGTIKDKKTNIEWGK
jgi:hypothetical protein